MSVANELRSLRAIFEESQGLNLFNASLILPMVPSVELVYDPLARLFPGLPSHPTTAIGGGGHRTKGRIELSLFNTKLHGAVSEFNRLATMAIDVIADRMSVKIPHSFSGLNTESHRWADYVHNQADAQNSGIFQHRKWLCIQVIKTPHSDLPHGYGITGQGYIDWHSEHTDELKVAMEQVANGVHQVRLFNYNIVKASIFAIDRLIEQAESKSTYPSSRKILSPGDQILRLGLREGDQVKKNQRAGGARKMAKRLGLKLEIVPKGNQEWVYEDEFIFIAAFYKKIRKQAGSDQEAAKAAGKMTRIAICNDCGSVFFPAPKSAVCECGSGNVRVNEVPKRA